jgi:addiction module RelE/StbE family toxin
MWDIYEHQRVAKQIKAAPAEVLKRYEKWKDIMALSGPNGIRQIKGFHDEVLKGEWKQHRSSRLRLQYRVIYQVIKNQVLIQVVNLTPHGYRKK